MPTGSVCTILTGAGSATGWGTVLKDSFIQGKQSAQGIQAGINLKELRVLVSALEALKDVIKGR